MSERRVVIIGAGVAGLSTAYWLKRANWQVTVLERAPNLRFGGYMMGLSGPCLDVATKMGLRHHLDQIPRTIEEQVYKDQNGRELARLPYKDLLKELPFIVLRRTDLVEALYGLVKQDVEIILNAQITSIQSDTDGASVTLDDGTAFRGDLVIGADGVRSFVRNHCFGPDDTFLKSLGYRFAAYSTRASDHSRHDFVSYAQPGRINEFYSLDDKQLIALHIWRETEETEVSGKKPWDVLCDIASTSHPDVINTVAIAKERGEPLVLDDMVMVDMPKWSHKRVMLLGDSAHCLTLVSGQGAGMALVSASILGEKLATLSIDDALIAHEAQMRPTIEHLQMRSRKMARVFVPASKLTFHLRNLVMRAVPKSWIAHYLIKGIRSEALENSKIAA
ncbi:MAG: FAD-dependent oxidoreductase [Pseudomonadota bacterium]